jgi:omega-6 fatty acid desaturase (delta-12 desaturase)
VNSSRPPEPAFERADERALIEATRPFAVESPWRSHWALASTLALVAAGTAATVLLRHPGARFAAATVLGLLYVRVFVIFHDAMHGAIFRRSPVARAVLNGAALAMLTPPSVWRDTHNYHHAHTAKIVGSHVGSFPMVTPGLWARMSRKDRMGYVLARSPLTILLALPTVFFLGMCVNPLRRAPRKHADAVAAILAFASISAAILWTAGVTTWILAYVYPLALATTLGAYMFYAQHNFPDAVVQPRESWSYVKAALQSSSFMEMGPIMRYFSGNIGYHHVHHLNARIPFYRLPDAMAALPELQSPGRTSLRPKDIANCLRLTMWSPKKGRMITTFDAPG